MTGGVGLEQERDYGDGQGTAFGAPRLQLRLPDRADSRMKNLFQAPAGCDIGENASGQFIPAESAIAADDVFAENLLNFNER